MTVDCKSITCLPGEYVTDDDEDGNTGNLGLSEGITFIDEHDVDYEDLANLTNLVHIGKVQ